LDDVIINIGCVEYYDYRRFIIVIAQEKFVDTKNGNKTGSWHVVAADDIAQQLC